MSEAARPRVAVHKFSSCDGCQLALLNLGEDLLALAEAVELVHFAEAGQLAASDTDVDIAFVEGSIATPHDVARLKTIREHSRLLIAIGACATSGGVQALRNATEAGAWLVQLYPQADAVASLPASTPLAAHVKVDFELWGCPVSSAQMVAVVKSLLLGVAPVDTVDKVCTECKRAGHPCVLVSKGVPCLGPVTRAGCGALCPGVGRDCYGCYGPAELANTDSLADQFARLGLDQAAITRRFAFINSQAPVFRAAAEKTGGDGNQS